MSTTPVPARPTAGVSGARPTQGPDLPVAAITIRRRAYLLGRMHLVQLLVLESAVLAIAATIDDDRQAFIGAGVLAVFLIIAAVSRWRGRWLPVSVQLALRLRRRERARPIAELDPRLSLLRCLAPQLAVQDIAGPQGTRVGVGYDGEGWFAVAAVSPRPGGEREPADPLPPSVLARILDPFPLPGRQRNTDAATAQVVTLTVPASLIEAGAGPERTTWVAVRVDARFLAQTGDGDPDASSRAPHRLLRLARRMPRTLESAGFSGQLLDADELLDALVRCCALLPAADAPVVGVPVADLPVLRRSPAATVPLQPREHWTSWAVNDLQQVTYWVRQWPAVGTEQALLDAIGHVPDALTAVALRIFADDNGAQTDTAAPVLERFDLRALVRVAAPADRIEAAGAEVNQAAQACGAQLQRLDGEHAPAVYASAPTGGGAR